jgi:hypothetical protein
MKIKDKETNDKQGMTFEEFEASMEKLFCPPPIENRYNDMFGNNAGLQACWSLDWKQRVFDKNVAEFGFEKAIEHLRSLRWHLENDPEFQESRDYKKKLQEKKDVKA